MTAPLDWRKAAGAEADAESDALRRVALNTICARLEEGESLRAICKTPGLPSIATFFRWVEDDEAAREQYARARDRQADVLATEIIDIVDGNDDPQNKRVRMDARKWLAGKLKPKVYGDRLDLNATVRRDASELSDAELATIASQGRRGVATAPEDSD